MTSPQSGKRRGPQLTLGPGGPSAQLWMTRAQCKRYPALFFSEKTAEIEAAKHICAGCPVRAECESYALERNEEHGTWGGLSEDERYALKHGEGRKLPRPRRPRRPARSPGPADPRYTGILVTANAVRIEQTAARDAELARHILTFAQAAGWPERWPQEWREVAEARVTMPGTSWSGLGLALGLTRYQAAARFRRLRQEFLSLQERAA